MVTHDANAAVYARRTINILDGRIVAEGLASPPSFIGNARIAVLAG